MQIKTIVYSKTILQSYFNMNVANANRQRRGVDLPDKASSKGKQFPGVIMLFPSFIYLTS